MALNDIDTSTWGNAKSLLESIPKILANFNIIKALTANDFGAASTDDVAAKAAKGANSDITSLSGLTTALSVAQGGTGATDAATARANLGAAPAGYGLGTYSTVVTGDLNDIKITGFYYADSAAQNNKPVNVNGYLLVEANHSSYVTQKFVQAVSGTCYLRSCVESVWSAWKQLAFTDSPVFTGIVETAGQVKFPATQNPSSDPNCLDDYEEGAWTPTIGSAANPSGQTYQVQVGRYTKNGNKVSCLFKLRLTNKGSVGEGALYIFGLPFTINSAITGSSSISYAINMSSQLSAISGVGIENTAIISLTGSASASTAPLAELQTSILTDTSFIIGSIEYQV